MAKLTNFLLPVCVLLGGFALRLYRLGAQSLWYDETVSAVLAQESIPELVAHTARDIHPPGYYLLLHGWVRLAGNSEFALAFFSLGFGVLLIAAAYRLGRLWLNKPAALWGAALVAVSPFNVWYSQEVRMYTLGACLAAAAVYSVWKGVTAPARGRATFWAVYAIVAAIGLYTLYYVGFLLAALNLYAAALLATELGRRGPEWRSKAVCWLAANLAAVVLYLPWLGTAWRQAANPPVPPWRSEVPLWRIALESWSALSLGESVRPGQLWSVLGLTLALFGIGLAALKANRLRALLLCATIGPPVIMALVPLLGGPPLYHPRYLFTYSLPFYLILGAGLAWLGSKRRAVAAGTALVLVAGAGYSIIRLHTDPQFAADDLRGAAVFLQQAWRPGDTIIVNAGYTYTALRHYYTAPVDRYLRLADFTPGTAQRNPYAPLVLQTGSVNGPPSLGWGDPQSDFYAMSEQETIAALQAVSKQYPRLWVLRAYDTVTDPAGIIRHWLSENTLQFEDRPIGGPSNFRVQGFFSPKQPPPPQQTDDTFAGRFKLRGFTPPGSRYHAGDKIYVTLWLEALAGLSAEPPYAVSLKLWDSRGNMAAQSDEWPAGSLYFSPQWPPGQIVRHPMQLQLPPDTRPGQYWLDVQLYRSDGSVPLPVNGSDKTGVTLGKIEVVGENPGRVAPH